MKKSHRPLLLGAAAASLVAGLGAGAPAQAQTQPSAEEETIVVTARRREETLQETPVAVTAIGAAQIEDLQINSIDDVARFAPGLSFSKTFGRSTDRPVIRGQSNVLANVQFGVESGTAYFVDGVYFPSSIQSFDLGDVARVEVIKGPQSALYGRNTYAGAINFVTRDPRETAFNASYVVADHGERDFRYSMEGPLSDTLSGRFSIRRYDYDGEFTNTVTGRLVGDESTFSMAGLLLWEPTDNLSFRLRGSYTLDDDGPLPIFFQSAAANNCMPGWRSLAAWPYSASANRNQYYCGVIQPGQVALSTDAVSALPAPVPGVPVGSSNPTFFPFVSPAFPVYSTADGTAFDGIERETFMTSLISSWDIGGSGYTLDIDLAARLEEERFGTDSDHSSVNHIRGTPGVTEAFFANTSRDMIDDYSAEARFSTPTSNRIRGTLGAFFFRAANDGYDITFANQNGVFTETGTTTNRAIFALAEADLTDSLTLTLEGRAAEEEKTATGLPPVTFDNFTPRVTLSWNPAPDWTLYGIYSEGVKPGGLNGAIGIANGLPQYEQEESENQEIGLKGSLFDGRLVFSTALYHIEATNVQLTTPAEITFGASTSLVTNQGNGETWGAEFEARWAVTDNLNISGGYAWTNPEFTSGCDEDQWTLTSGGGRLRAETTSAPGTGTSFDPLTGAQLAYGSLGDCSIAGKRYPLSSEHQANFAVDWSSPLSNGLEIFANANATYESSKYVQVHNLAETGETLLVGGRFGIEGEHWSLAAFGRNLTDEDTITLATRWLTNPYSTVFGFTNIAPSTSPGAPVGATPLGAQRSAPRGFFGGLRPGRTLGVELRVRY